MVKSTDIYPQGAGAFLRTTDVTDDIEALITGYYIKELLEGPPNGPKEKRNRTILKLAGFDKELRMTATNIRRMEAAYGEEMDDWVGRKIIMYPDQVKTPSGMVWSVCIRIPKKFQAEAPAPRKEEAKPEYTEENPPPADDDGRF